MTGCTQTNTDAYHTIAGNVCNSSVCRKGVLRLGVFFDGTGNDDKNPVDYSNVMKIHDVYPENHYENKVTIHRAYMRGVGSRTDKAESWGEKANWYSSKVTQKPKYGADKNYATDGTASSAWGKGGFARIDGMLALLQDAMHLHKTNSGGFFPTKVKLDVFGFSRGAIQARHFVNVIKQGFYQLDGAYSDFEPGDFTIETLNVFDSVSSFEFITVATPGTPQDPGWAFNIGAGMVRRTIHFMADDEFRQNFDGQVINGSQNLDYPKNISSTVFKELVFLGAHSDIGGGYRPVAHGRNNNDLAKIYLNKMYEMAKENDVPLEDRPSSDPAWKITKSLDVLFSDIQGSYDDYTDLKKAHKQFRERMGYLYDPGSNQTPAFQLPAELNRAINTNKKEILSLTTTIRGMENKIRKTSGVRQRQYRYEQERARNHKRQLKGKNHNMNEQLDAYTNLKKAFSSGSDQDFEQFVESAIEFHNTYVHKSHSGMFQLGRSDYDAHGNKIPNRSRDKAGMNAEIDGGIFTDGYLHRHWYHAKHIDVVSAICEREKAEKMNKEIFTGFAGTVGDYATRPGRWIASKAGLTKEFSPFDWAKPVRFS